MDLRTRSKVFMTDTPSQHIVYQYKVHKIQCSIPILGTHNTANTFRPVHTIHLYYIALHCCIPKPVPDRTHQAPGAIRTLDLQHSFKLTTEMHQRISRKSATVCTANAIQAKFTGF